jgi:hypothetical protein
MQFGTFFPADVMNNQWGQFNSATSGYNVMAPQLKISGLSKDSVYYVRMTGSFQYDSWDCNPVMYTVAGKTVAASQYLNAQHNVTMGVTFQKIAPDSDGVIKVYVNTVSGSSEMASISGIQIISGSATIGMPAVAITSPDNNDILPEETNITINATASETGTTITKVEFYADSTKIGEADAAPYTISWNNPDEGHYMITAKATDAAGTTNIATINVSIESLSSFWSLTGNIRANADTNFLGTVDTNRLAIRTNNVERVSILGDGTVGIGTKNTQGYKLAVNGNAIFTKVRIKAYNAWPDYVFKKEYQLPGLDSLDKYIRLHQHLPGIAPAAEVKTVGMDVADGQATLLKKVEELTLYLIREHKEVEKLTREVERLKAQDKKGKTPFKGKSY